MRFLTTAQLARLFFEGSKWAANKRLRKLLDAGLIRPWVRDLAEDNVYSLDQKGLGVLDDSDSGPNHTVPRGLDGNIDHLLAINQVRISLALDLPEVGGEIAWWRSDWELRSCFRERIIPDALFAIRWASGEQAFSLEVDNQTRSLRAFIKKVLGYSAVGSRSQGLYGISTFLTLVVGCDPEWVERYRHSLSRVGLGLPVWFATLPEIDREGALGSIWRPVEGEESYSLRDLKLLPYGKEGHDAEAAIETRV